MPAESAPKRRRATKRSGPDSEALDGFVDADEAPEDVPYEPEDDLGDPSAEDESEDDT
jgi:hypothetical protein